MAAEPGIFLPAAIFLENWEKDKKRPKKELTFPGSGVKIP
jgi:hypothetical protein